MASFTEWCLSLRFFNNSNVAGINHELTTGSAPVFLGPDDASILFLAGWPPDLCCWGSPCLLVWLDGPSFTVLSLTGAPVFLVPWLTSWPPFEVDPDEPLTPGFELWPDLDSCPELSPLFLSLSDCSLGFGGGLEAPDPMACPRAVGSSGHSQWLDIN